MRIKKTKIEGCFELMPEVFTDIRGDFIKIFNKDIFLKNNLETLFEEEYFSVSKKRVLRGLHFQLPPKELTKIVYCIYGKIIDVVVDLRVDSKTYGKYEIFKLSSQNRKMIYIPAGLAHGFYVLSNKAITVYKANKTFFEDKDSGIRWNSLDIPWVDKNPIISEKDKNLISFKDFTSPF